jgi:hypothetical protein
MPAACAVRRAGAAVAVSAWAFRWVSILRTHDGMVAEWGGVSISTVPLEIEAPPGHETGVISGDAGLANLGSHGVNRARRGGADVADKGRTAIARASHACLSIIDQVAGNPIEIGVTFQSETWPFRRERAACTAGST